MKYLFDLETSTDSRLRFFLNMGTLQELPTDTSAPNAEGIALYQAIRNAGFVGVQSGDSKLAQEAGLAYAGGGRVDQVGDAGAICRELKESNAVCGTLHVGWGFEDDSTIDALLNDIFEQAETYDMPLYIETHRATITQDTWRSLQLVKRFPQIKFNADYSHWYTGLEMQYGDIEEKFDYCTPAFERAGFMHGRIGNSGMMQVPIGDSLEEALEKDYVQHFIEMWKRTFKGFLKHSNPNDYLVFAPELLPCSINYQQFTYGSNGEKVEIGDRWKQALVMVDVVKHTWELANTETQQQKQ